MKKILFFGYTLEVGGAEKVLIDFLNILKSDYEIDLALLEKKGDFIKDVPDNIKIIQMRNNNFSYFLFRYIPFYRKMKINKIANLKNYDVAIGFFEGRSATWVADIKKNITRIAWLHNDVNKFDIGIPEKEIKDSYNKMDKIIAVSEVSKENFKKKYDINENKIKVLYNLVDEKSIIEKSNEFEVINDVFTFTNVGKMRPQKRQDRLVRIAYNLKKSGYKFKIQIIGDGPEESNIKELIKKYDVSDVVELLGLQINPYPYIKNANCIVVSSDFEGYSISMKEALILKKPIISTDVSGARELFEGEKYGIISEISDEDLEKKMKDVLDEKIDISEIEKNLENFDNGNSKIINDLYKLIEE